MVATAPDKVKRKRLNPKDRLKRKVKKKHARYAPRREKEISLKTRDAEASAATKMHPTPEVVHERETEAPAAK